MATSERAPRIPATAAMNCIVLRGAGFMGSHLVARSRTPIEVWGDGRVVRDYLYVGDVVDAMVRALDYRGPHRVINIGNRVGRDLNQLLAAIETVVGRSVERTFRRAAPMRPPTCSISGLRALRWAGHQPRPSRKA